MSSKGSGLSFTTRGIYGEEKNLVIPLIFFCLILASCTHGQTDISSNQPTKGLATSGNQALNSNTPTLGGLASEVVQSSKFQGYKTYKNYRFGYSLDYPGDFI